MMFHSPEEDIPYFAFSNDCLVKRVEIFVEYGFINILNVFVHVTYSDSHIHESAQSAD